MRSEKLRDMAAIAEVVGTAGLIISLFFVAYSINKNTEEVHASQSNSIYAVTRQVELAVASDAEWTRIVVLGQSDEGSLSGSDQYRYDAYLGLTLDNWDQLLNRYQGGFISDETFSGWNQYFEKRCGVT